MNARRTRTFDEPPPTTRWSACPVEPLELAGIECDRERADVLDHLIGSGGGDDRHDDGRLRPDTSCVPVEDRAELSLT